MDHHTSQGRSGPQEGITNIHPKRQHEWWAKGHMLTPSANPGVSASEQESSPGPHMTQNTAPAPKDSLF